MQNHLIGLVAALAACGVGSPRLFAQEKPEDVKTSIVVAAPLGVSPGRKATVVFRGRKLDVVERVATGDVSAEVKIIEKKASPPPSKDQTNRLGDTELTLEITVAADSVAPALPLVVASPDGSSEPFLLPISPADKTVLEVEPNDGYSQPQAMELGQVALGTIHEKQNVDVFAFAGTAGKRVAIEIQAARSGSPLDSFLTLTTADGRRIVATNDDFDGGRDSRIETTLPSDGRYLVIVQDALDAGGQAYSYRLTVAEAR